MIAGGVGWTDLATPDADARMGALARYPRLHGLRPTVRGWPTIGTICRTTRPWRRQDGTGLVLDALIQPRHLDSFARLPRPHLKLTIEIDHAAKPQAERFD